MKKYKLIILSVFCFGSLNTFSQGLIGQDSTHRVITTAVPFLSITPDSRSGAMGDVGVAISPDANAIYHNPAKLAFLETNDGFALSYTPWLGKIINDMFITYLAGYHKLTREQTIGMSMRYFDLGEIFFTDENAQELGQFNPREFAFSGSYSRMLSEELSVGLVLQYIHSNLTGSFSSGGLDARPGNSVSGDLGVYYTKEILSSGRQSELSLGAVISNVGGKLTYSDENNKDFLPTNLRLGSAYTAHLDPYNKITIAIDAGKLMVPSPPVRDATGKIIRGKDPDRSMLSGVFGSLGDAPDGFSEEMKEFVLSTGVEYWYNDSFAGRIGYFMENETKGNRKYLTMGLGLRYQMFGIDFAYLVPREKDHPLAETLRFTLAINFEDTSANDETVVE